MNAIALFRWNDKLPSEAEVGAVPATRYSADYGEQWAYQAGQPVAIAVLHVVRQLGIKTDVDTPYYGECGWHFCMYVDGKLFSVCVQWVPGGDMDDCFAVQPSLPRGCVGLLLSRPAEHAVEPACLVLRQALASDARITDLKWVREI